MPRRRDLKFIFWWHVPRYSTVIDTVHDSYYSLEYLEAGDVHVHIDGRYARAHGGALWCVKPGQRIQHRTAVPGHTYAFRGVTFQGRLADYWESLGLFPAQPLQARSPATYAEDFDEFLSAVGEPSPLDHMRAVNSLERMLLRLAQEGRQPSSSPDWLETVVDEMTGDLAGELDASSLAASLGMSVSTLRRRFRREMGVPMHAFRIRLKIDSARRALLETNRPLKAIAGDLGYRDVHAFSKQFHQYAGLPPATYRRSCRRRP